MACFPEPLRAATEAGPTKNCCDLGIKRQSRWSLAVVTALRNSLELSPNFFKALRDTPRRHGAHSLGAAIVDSMATGP